jgi:rhamnogalacturonan hydrolase
LIASTSNYPFVAHPNRIFAAPAFHLVLDSCSNGELYNMIIRRGSEGGLDGIDIWGSNIHVHDVEVKQQR